MLKKQPKIGDRNIKDRKIKYNKQRNVWKSGFSDKNSFFHTGCQFSGENKAA